MISAELRRTVRTLYAFACGYCGVSETEVGAYLTIDHFQPQNEGGSNDLSNLVYACHVCNLHKSIAWNPLAPPVLHPLRAEMDLHIRALPEGTIEGLTPEGNRHIDSLQLNRAPSVERRKIRRLIENLLELEAELQRQNKQVEQEIKNKKRTLRRKGQAKR